MFHTSTHRKNWIFSNVKEIDELRENCIKNYGTKYSISADDLITLDEHKVLSKHYEKILFHYCQKFQPPLPYSVIFTAFLYFKRIYLQTSIMESPPQDMLSVCLYMACKVEEYNVSVDKFIMIYPETERIQASDVILSNEMGLMRLLNYQLIVHSPKRALEGFFIDIKTRFQQKDDFDECRETSNDFLNALLLSDAVFLYTPSQLALAALFAASKEIVRNYIFSVLAPDEQRETLFSKVVAIIKLINTKIICEESHVKEIQTKLSKLPVSEKKAKKRKMSNGDEEGSIKRQRSSDIVDDETAEVSAVDINKE